MGIDYDHSQNLHTTAGPKAAFSKLFHDGLPGSILDVGCGTGTWLRAALDCGVLDVVGLDGVEIPREQLLLPHEKFLCRNLNTPVDLGRRFDVVTCLEVAEHLEPEVGKVLIQTLTRHADKILFSAACPDQPGQHHVNCQWPDYWQSLFNSQGFICSDSIRWQIWDDQNIEPWYRQNLFAARHDPQAAGKEDRIKRVVHPDFLMFISKGSSFPCWSEDVRRIEQGALQAKWYVTVPFKAIPRKIARHIGLGSKP